jgi:hypothetical protein
MKKSADPIIQEKESANSAYKKSEMFLRRIGRPVLFSPQKTMLNLQTIFIQGRSLDQIINSIIDMSKKIGVDTLIEGVETSKQFERLYTMGCKLYQGFYFSKPVDLESFEKQWFD